MIYLLLSLVKLKKLFIITIIINRQFIICQWYMQILGSISSVNHVDLRQVNKKIVERLNIRYSVLFIIMFDGLLCRRNMTANIVQPPVRRTEVLLFWSKLLLKKYKSQLFQFFNIIRYKDIFFTFLIKFYFFVPIYFNLFTNDINLFIFKFWCFLWEWRELKLT